MTFIIVSRICVAAVVVAGVFLRTHDGARIHSASEAGAVLWADAYNGPSADADVVGATAESPDGSVVYLTGSSAPPNGGVDVTRSATVAVDATTGRQLWVQRSTAHPNCGGESVAVSPDGSAVFAIMYCDYQTGVGHVYSYLTAAFRAATGAQIWQARQPADKDQTGAWSGVSPDGRTLYSLVEAPGNNGARFGLSAYGATTGVVRWSRKYRDPRGTGSVPAGLAVSPDGRRVFVTGTSLSYYDVARYVTVAYGTKTGKWLWSQTHLVCCGRYQASSFALAVTPDGAELVVTGSLSAKGPSETFGYSAVTGQRSWATKTAGVPTGLVLSPDSATAFVSGRSHAALTLAAISVATGSTLWARRYPGSGRAYATGPSTGESMIAVSPDGAHVFAVDLGNGYTTDLVALCVAARDGSRLWQSKAFSPAEEGKVVTLMAPPTGEVVLLAGTIFTDGQGPDYALTAFDPQTGMKPWTYGYNGPGRFNERAFAVTASPNGSRVFVTGAVRAEGPSESLRTGNETVAYDAQSGHRIWATRYDGIPDLQDALAVSPDGSTVFVGIDGFSSDQERESSVITAYDSATGHIRWGAYGPDETTAISVSPDGSTLFAAGSAYASDKQGPFLAYEVSAFSTDTGERLWDAVAGRELEGEARSMALSADGTKVFVTGGVATGTRRRGTQYGTVAYDATDGATLWTARYTGGRTTSAGIRVVVSADGSRVAVVGAGDYEGNYGIVVYDTASGGEFWARRFGGPTHGCWAAATVAVGPDGQTVFATGVRWRGGSHLDYLTVAYDLASGNRRWSNDYDGPSGRDDIPSAAALSPNGSRVLVTGASRGPGSYDYATLALDQSTGVPVWVRRYDGSGHGRDGATSIAVSPDGSEAYVTGSATGRNSGLDFLTLAYAV